MIAPNVAHIPNFITAASPQGLRRLILLNNIKKGHVFVYQIQFSNGKWYAWYNDTVEAFAREVINTPEEQLKDEQ